MSPLGEEIYGDDEGTILMVSGKKCGSWSSYGQLVSNALILHALSKIGREEVESKQKKKNAVI